MKRLFLQFIVFCLCSMPGMPAWAGGWGRMASSQKRIFQTVNNELSYQSVRDISEDGNGFIWIATLKGLNRYDGYGITKFYAEDGGLISSCIECVEAVGKNVLIGTDKGLCIYDASLERIFPVRCDRHPAVTDMEMIDTCRAAIGTTEGLFIFDIAGRTLAKADTLAVDKLTKDPLGTIWTINKTSVTSYTPEGRRKRSVRLRQENGKRIVPSEIYSDSKGMIWLGTTESGLYLFNRTDESVSPISTGNYKCDDLRYIRCIMEEDTGRNIWIGTENGLFIYDYTTDLCEHYYKEPHNGTDSGNINDNAIYSIFESSDDIVWIGTFFGGVNYTDIKKNRFWTINDRDGNYFLDGAAVSSICADSRGRLWFATENKGLFILDSRSQAVKAINTESFPCISGTNVHAVSEDPYGYIWAGNFIDGLFRFSPDLKSQPKQFKNRENSRKSLQGNSVYCILSDRPDSMYIGFDTGVSTYNFETGRFSPLRPDVLDNVRIDDIIRDCDGNIWMAAHFDGIFKYNPLTGDIVHFHSGNAAGRDMASNSIFCCHEDFAGNVWFGTNSGGILKYDRQTNDIDSFGEKSELSERDVYFIDEDSSGNLWLSTDDGIYSFNPLNGVFSIYKVPIISNQFNYNAGYKNPINGQMYFGSINGVAVFQPEDIARPDAGPAPEIFLSVLKVNNRTMVPGDGDILAKSLDMTDNIVLKHNDRTFSIDFICIDFNYMSRNRYKCEYMLKGNDRDWIDAGMKHNCGYSNLSPGKYEFIVRLRDIDGKILQTRMLGIHVRPHILSSPGAWVLYTILLLSACALSLKGYRNRVKDRMNLRIQEIEKKNLELANKHRTDFFTYISYEFKTPLTILAAIFEDFGQRDGNTFISSQEKDIIMHNTRRMMFLINQLSEFRQLESQHAGLNLINGDIIGFSRKIFLLFVPLFERKSLTYNFSSNAQQCITNFDADKIEKILSNFLSNAVKYAVQEADSIAISLDISIYDGRILYICHNTGSYISPEQQAHILHPFLNTEPDTGHGGRSGIGLALVKELVDLMSGTMSIESSPDGGTSFTVSFPERTDVQGCKVSSPAASRSTLEIIDDTVYAMDHLETGQAESAIDAGTDTGQKKNILLIGSDPEIRHMLRKKLKNGFNIRPVHTEDLKQILPAAEKSDLIIYDIHSADYSLCKALREDERTRHLPVIILTCENSKENKLLALEAGASSVISKPFSVVEIILKIRNLLESKNSIREYYAGLSQMDLGAIPSQKNELFIKKLTAVIENNIQTENLTVDFLANQMNVSRTVLYMRLKESLDISATEFINKVRISKAVQMMKDGEESVSEIAWKTGFNSPSYFSKIFKKLKGQSPASYMKSAMETKN